MKHFIHKVTLHYKERSNRVSMTPNTVVHSDRELEELREQYKNDYHADSVTMTESSFDGNLNAEQIEELKQILLTY